MKRVFYNHDEAIKAMNEFEEQIKKELRLSVVQKAILRTFYGSNLYKEMNPEQIRSRVGLPFPVNEIEIRNELGPLLDEGLIVVVANQPVITLALTDKGREWVTKDSYREFPDTVN